MICGLKTALGGGRTIDRNHKDQGAGGALEGKVSAKGVTDVASLQVKFAAERKRGSLHDVKATQQFIFAYRLRRIKYDKKLKDKPFTEEVIEFYGDEDHVPDDADPEDREPSIKDLLDYNQRYEMADPDYDDAEPDTQDMSISQ
jgi:hypothetical protein